MPADAVRTDDPPLTHLMSHRVTVAAPQEGLDALVRSMAGHGVRHLAVHDGTRCTGIVLAADVAAALVDRPGGTAADVQRPVPALEPTARRSDAARRMRATGVDAVLVTDGERLLGIVTATDLVRSLAVH